MAASIESLENYAKISQVFAAVKENCSRSSTKERTLHQDEKKDLYLAALLEQVRVHYGQGICNAFQEEYVAKQPVLSFLFAQITNAILQSAFRQGSCHAQAAYCLFELFKVDIFTATLGWSRTFNESTEHYYVVIPDEYSFNQLKESIPKDYNYISSGLKKSDDLFVRVSRSNGKPSFGKETIFFDSWSEKFCRWQDFTPEKWRSFSSKSRYTEGLSTADQALFKPLILWFKNDKLVFLERIVWCISEYKRRLEKLRIANTNSTFSSSPFGFKIDNSLPQQDDSEFDKETSLLSSREHCFLILIDCLNRYQRDFTKQLKAEYKKRYLLCDSGSAEISKKDKLNLATCLFFHEQDKQSLWKTYPGNSLKGRYVGHEVYFFNMPDASNNTVESFKDKLDRKGFDAIVSKTKKGPSIVVDLTTSLREENSKVAPGANG